MTTITIKNGKNISRTDFEDIDELLAYFMDKMEFGTLLPLDKKDVTIERKKRFEKALSTPKSKMLNI
jgi:hypothetical protein